MAETVEYTFTGGGGRKIQVQSPKKFTVECAFSGGKGDDPGVWAVPQDCGSCRGQGWITFDGKPEQYYQCPECHGAGRDPAVTKEFKPCHRCHGAGIVKIH